MKGDTSYLVRCPIHNPAEENGIIEERTMTTTMPPIGVNMQILEDKKDNDVAKVGQNYDMKLAIPFKKGNKAKNGNLKKQN